MICMDIKTCLGKCLGELFLTENTYFCLLNFLLHISNDSFKLYNHMFAVLMEVAFFCGLVPYIESSVSSSLWQAPVFHKTDAVSRFVSYWGLCKEVRVVVLKLNMEGLCAGS